MSFLRLLDITISVLVFLFDFGVPARVVLGGLGTARTAAEPQRRAFREFFVVSLVAFMLSVKFSCFL